MDHQDQHHQRKEKERDEHRKEQREHDSRAVESGSPIHPAWFVAIGVVLVGAVILVWTLAF